MRQLCSFLQSEEINVLQRGTKRIVPHFVWVNFPHLLALHSVEGMLCYWTCSRESCIVLHRSTKTSTRIQVKTKVSVLSSSTWMNFSHHPKAYPAAPHLPLNFLGGFQWPFLQRAEPIAAFRWRFFMIHILKEFPRPFSPCLDGKPMSWKLCEHT